MNSKEAKDFLVQETARQAAIQGIPLSDLEKRMMYFTEQDDSCENPVQLNEEFDAQYDSAEYEKKLGGLLLNALPDCERKIPQRFIGGNNASACWQGAIIIFRCCGIPLNLISAHPMIL